MALLQKSKEPKRLCKRRRRNGLPQTRSLYACRFPTSHLHLLYILVQVEIDVPPEARYHSIFTCPVSKEQTTEMNPPMMLTCGHVLAKDSIAKLAKSGQYVPYMYPPNDLPIANPPCTQTCEMSLLSCRIDSSCTTRFLLNSFCTVVSYVFYCTRLSVSHCKSRCTINFQLTSPEYMYLYPRFFATRLDGIEGVRQFRCVMPHKSTALSKLPHNSLQSFAPPNPVQLQKSEYLHILSAHARAVEKVGKKRKRILRHAQKTIPTSRFERLTSSFRTHCY